MKAITKYRYGGPEVLNYESVPHPLPQGNEVLVKVMANSANPADWHIMRGKPYFARLQFGLSKPTQAILGSDFAGIVEAIGPEVQNLKPGDRVFGENMQGAFAEYCLSKESVMARMPQESSFEEMAGLPIAGLTAYQGLLEHGKLKSGERVLINGASGGVGHFALQIAKAYGARVSAVCSSKNKDFVKNLGAETVLAYDDPAWASYQEQHDLVVDCHGNLKHADLKRLGRRAVLIGFTGMAPMLRLLACNMFSKYPLAQFTAQARKEDLEMLAQLVEEGQVQTHIDRSYAAPEIPLAIAYIEKMRTRGKVVMRWEH